MANNTKTKKKSKKPQSKARTSSKKTTKKANKKGKKKMPPMSKKGIIVAVVSAVLVLAIVIGAVAIHNADRGFKTIPLDVDKDVAWGIDVSAHNGSIDWEAVSSEADFAFIRVGYRGYSNGSLSYDKLAKKNLKQAKKVAMPVGVYFYSQAITPEEAEEEAEFVLDLIKGYRVTLPVVIDYEYAYEEDGELGGRLYNAKLGRSEGGKIVAAFCDVVEDAGYIPAVYASSSLYQTKINTKALSKNTVIWVADYNDKVTYLGDYDIWQYSKKGKCKGVSSTYVDMDYWYLKR